MKRFVNKASQLSLALLASVVFAASHLYAVDTMESLIAGAKKEDELVFIAGAQTFGGRKGLAEIEGAFKPSSFPRKHKHLFTLDLSLGDLDVRLNRALERDRVDLRRRQSQTGTLSTAITQLAPLWNDL